MFAVIYVDLIDNYIRGVECLEAFPTKEEAEDCIKELQKKQLTEESQCAAPSCRLYAVEILDVKN